MERSDDELISQYRSGHAEAFEALFERHHGRVYQFARMMLRDAGAAEEVLQEAFLAVARAAGSYESRGQFPAWLMRIVRNLCLNRIESERLRCGALVDAGAADADCPSGQPSPPRSAEAAEEWTAVQRAIAGLPQRQREAIVLYAMEDLSYREIAHVLDVPTNTVKTLIHRARAALAAALADHDEENDRGL